MKNPSEANDEGITALHNSICAGHFDVVKFLVELGCDVNAADTDGWYVWISKVLCCTGRIIGRFNYDIFAGWITQPTVSKHCRRVVSRAVSYQSQQAYLTMLQQYIE